MDKMTVPIDHPSSEPVYIPVDVGIIPVSGVPCASRNSAANVCTDENARADFQVLYHDHDTRTWMVWGDSCPDHLADTVNGAIEHMNRY